MERASQIKKLSDKGKIWDMVVVGGGATGLGVAVDAATRGMSVACLEKTDFAKCTSSRSTKLVHGGVRYLQKGDVMLVLEALRERGRMKANAPHLVKDQAFVISNYRYWDNFLYFCGLTFYDLLSFGFGYGRSKYISAKKVMKYIPTSVEKGLKGGVVYHDGQFDDSRMAINLAQTCVENGGTVVNEATVTGILHNEAGKVAGVKFVDNTTGEEYSIKARSVVNAAGCFVDDIMHMDSPEHRKMVTPSQGVHLVLDMKFLQSDYAIMVPKTSDGRVLFAVPWHDKVVVGTTDIVRPTPEEEPRPLKEEIDFILGTAGLYMNPAPTYKDILSVFAGQRPLAAPKKEGKNTKEISRSHKVITSDNGLVTITGGKWTSYRLMAQDALLEATLMHLVPARLCVTKTLPIVNDETFDAEAIEKAAAEGPMADAEVVAYALYERDNEGARTAEDVLYRRLRLGQMNAERTEKLMPIVAAAMAGEPYELEAVPEPEPEPEPQPEPQPEPAPAPAPAPAAAPAPEAAPAPQTPAAAAEAPKEAEKKAEVPAPEEPDPARMAEAVEAAVEKAAAELPELDVKPDEKPEAKAEPEAEKAPEGKAEKPAKA